MINLDKPNIDTLLASEYIGVDEQLTNFMLDEFSFRIKSGEETLHCNISQRNRAKGLWCTITVPTCVRRAVLMPPETENFTSLREVLEAFLKQSEDATKTYNLLSSKREEGALSILELGKDIPTVYKELDSGYTGLFIEGTYIGRMIVEPTLLWNAEGLTYKAKLVIESTPNTKFFKVVPSIASVNNFCDVKDTLDARFTFAKETVEYWNSKKGRDRLGVCLSIEDDLQVRLEQTVARVLKGCDLLKKVE